MYLSPSTARSTKGSACTNFTRSVSVCLGVLCFNSSHTLSRPTMAISSSPCSRACTNNARCPSCTPSKMPNTATLFFILFLATFAFSPLYCLQNRGVHIVFLHIDVEHFELAYGRIRFSELHKRQILKKSKRSPFVSLAHRKDSRNRQRIGNVRLRDVQFSSE